MNTIQTSIPGLDDENCISTTSRTAQSSLIGADRAGVVCAQKFDQARRLISFACCLFFVHFVPIRILCDFLRHGCLMHAQCLSVFVFCCCQELRPRTPIRGRDRGRPCSGLGEFVFPCGSLKLLFLLANARLFVGRARLFHATVSEQATKTFVLLIVFIIIVNGIAVVLKR